MGQLTVKRGAEDAVSKKAALPGGGDRLPEPLHRKGYSARTYMIPSEAPITNAPISIPSISACGSLSISFRFI